LPQDLNRSKHESLPTVRFLILFLKCEEKNDDLIKVDMDSTTVFFKSCKHIAYASGNDLGDLARACLYERKEASTTG
jgi:hypothetical protein